LQSQTGTGKTAAYAVPMLARVDLSRKETQGLILCHNRELALQVEKVVSALGSYLPVSVKSLVGGTSVGLDIKALQVGIQIVVGVPGRVCDMVKRKAFCLDKLKMLVLDDGEQLLSRSAKEHVYEVFAASPPDIQAVVVCVNAVEEMITMCGKCLRDPAQILIPRKDIPLPRIKYFYADVEKEQWKLDTLCDLYDSMTITQCLVFANTSRKVDWLTEQMRAKNFTVSSLHGDIAQSERSSILSEFRSGSSRVLICTDALSHGIDVQQVSLVINYDLTNNLEEFIHRAGRAGRFGRKGVNITLITTDDVRALREIEASYSITIAALPANLNELL